MTATPTPLRELIVAAMKPLFHLGQHGENALIDHDFDDVTDAVIAALSARDEAGAVGAIDETGEPYLYLSTDLPRGALLYAEPIATPPAASGDVEKAIRGVAQWLLHRFGPNTPEANEATALHAAADRLAAVAPAGMAVTAEMVREAFAHLPFDTKGYERWEWFANFINQALARPDEPCQCCGVTPSGQITGAT